LLAGLQGRQDDPDTDEEPGDFSKRGLRYVSVVAQQLGVRPFLGDGALQVVPQVPGDEPSVAGSNIRLGNGSLDVFASRAGNQYTTRLMVHGLRLRSLEIGQTLPRGTTAATVLLDGRPAHNVAARLTNRGVEVTVPVQGSGPHTLTVTAA
jgi:hypothetical protein